MSRAASRAASRDAGAAECFEATADCQCLLKEKILQPQTVGSRNFITQELRCQRKEVSQARGPWAHRGGVWSDPRSHCVSGCSGPESAATTSPAISPPLLFAFTGKLRGASQPNCTQAGLCPPSEPAALRARLPTKASPWIQRSA